MPEPIWVGDLRISDRTAHKLSTIHGLQADEVRDAVQCVRGLLFVWDDEPERGRRAVIRVRIRGRRYLVVLYPAHGLAEDDVWNLGSTYVE